MTNPNHPQLSYLEEITLYFGCMFCSILYFKFLSLLKEMIYVSINVFCCWIEPQWLFLWPRIKWINLLREECWNFSSNSQQKGLGQQKDRNDTTVGSPVTVKEFQENFSQEADLIITQTIKDIFQYLAPFGKKNPV